MNITSIPSQAPGGRNAGGAASVAGPVPGGSPAPAQVAAQQASVAPVRPAPETADVQKAVARAQEVLNRASANLKFAVDGDTGTMVVKVVDTETDQVIRQIPSEEMLAIARNIDRLQGLLVKQEA
jgi:flagellar protein FlaG